MLVLFFEIKLKEIMKIALILKVVIESHKVIYEDSKYKLCG